MITSTDSMTDLMFDIDDFSFSHGTREEKRNAGTQAISGRQ